MTTNTTGQGYKLQRGTATGSSLPAPGADTFTDVVDIESLTPPGASREVDEYFVLDQVASKKLVGPVTWSNLSGKLVRAWGDTVQDSMENDSFATGGTRRNWRIINNDPSLEQRDFVGYVNKFAEGEVTNRGRQTYDFEIVVDGSVTITR
jgi:hypothetical protein